LKFDALFLEVKEIVDMNKIFGKFNVIGI